MDLRKKIITLFNYRALPSLIELGGASPDEKNSLLEKLYWLQENIYYLDDVLESERDIDPQLLKQKWQAIYNSLHKCGIAEEDHDVYCRQIYRYQKHELSQRLGKSILRFDMEYFYFFKSCDVKLMRRIIYKKYPGLQKICRQADWRYFDLITELNDDIEDIYEDLNTINGNRFMLEVEKYGIIKAYLNFIDFLDNVYHKHLEKLTFCGVDCLLNQLTKASYINTKALLNQRLREIKEEGINPGQSVENYQSR